MLQDFISGHFNNNKPFIPQISGQEEKEFPEFEDFAFELEMGSTCFASKIYLSRWLLRNKCLNAVTLLGSNQLKILF